MAEALRAILNAWDDFRVYADEFRELDDQRVLALDHTAAVRRPAASSLDRYSREVRPCSMCETAG